MSGSSRPHRPVPVAVVAPGRLPLLGHVPHLLNSRHRLDYLLGLRAHGGLVTLYVGTRPLYVLTSADLVRQVLVADARKVGKGLLFERARPFFGNGLLTSDGQFHRRQRHMLQPAFHRAAVDRYTPLMYRVADQHFAIWRPGVVVAIEQQMHALATTMISQVLFADDAHHLAQAVRRSLPRLVSGVARRTLLPARLPLPGGGRYDRLGQDLRRTARELILHRQAATAAGARADHGQVDLISFMLQGSDARTAQRMTLQEMTDEVVTFLIAGIETTATALTWICHELGRRPRLQEELSAEADALTSGGPPVPDDLARLPLTTALITETLRLHNPVWLLMRRTHQPLSLGEALLPDGTEIIISPHVLHTDPAAYPDPLRFDPTRWTAD
ncbi:cytochrome P450, partial [Actinomadura kijaniata]|uniref:cytochrome P450 n=1 Tax=Actinomadura kijaniata TaxID=46161 RepID=UPI003F1B47EA